jgi:hypothetical protein
MRVNEVSNDAVPDAGRLVGLVQFLAGRADDTASKKRISVETFLGLAQKLGINITRNNLSDMLEQSPLSNLFEPFDPQSQFLVYKGGEQTSTAMPVNKAQDIVANMAKRAGNLP